MSGQPETANQRYYAAESLRTGQSRLMELSQQLVVQRCQVESYRASDLAAARDTYSQLQQTRKDLVAILADIRMLLMEVEETQLAAMAGQLQTGLRRFSLMSNTYRPVYDVLRDLAGKLPVEGKANAAVIGRLMNNVKMGYYPTDPDNISLILPKRRKFRKIVLTLLIEGNNISKQSGAPYPLPELFKIIGHAAQYQCNLSAVRLLPAQF